MVGQDNHRLRICLLSYRGNPHSGGQGVYIRHLSKALVDLGHMVAVVSGPPYPTLDKRIQLTKLASLDLYNPDDLFRMPTARELANPVNLIEWLDISTMGFPEPFTFGLRLKRFLRNQSHQYDIVHDNQSLSYGVRSISKKIPTVATIHHPITIDRQLAVRSAGSYLAKVQQVRWYSFINMQRRVSKSIFPIITVSKRARDDISRDFGIEKDNFRIVPNGIDTEVFRPLPGMMRDTHRVMVTNSADTPLKGLTYLLEAVAKVSRSRKIQLTVIGEPRKNGQVSKVIGELGLKKNVRFTGRIASEELVKHYAGSSVAVVPSVYEGFGFPAGEAMACATPVISTTAGALPEVIGNAGILVPPADSEALSRALISLLDNPDRAESLGRAGLKRIHHLFSWEKAGRKTVEAYREAIRAHHQLQ